MPEILATKMNVANLSVSKKHLYKALMYYNMNVCTTSFSCIYFGILDAKCGDTVSNSCLSMERA